MKTPKLLMADDSVTVRKVVELTFADEGVDVFAVADGEAAMQKFIEVQPDIVLVDVEMPGPNGYQICEMIKQDEATKHIPVLLLVGSFEPFDHDEAERVGADGFLTKPFQSIRELVARVNELLQVNEDDPVNDTIEIEATLPIAEPDDIEKLYNSSLASTMPIEELGLEDESSLGSSFDVVPIDEASTPEPELENGSIEEIATMPDTEDVEGPVERVRPISSTLDDESFFEDSVFDDQMIETVHPGGESRNGIESVTPDERPESFISLLEQADNDIAEAEHAAEEHETVKDFDWSPAAKVTEEAKPEPVEAGFEPRFTFSESDPTIEMNASGSIAHSMSLVDEPPAEPSEEFIALIAKRVVEKLSDHVIREIAQEAVPLIAEKLIREALEEDKKT